MRQMKVIRFYHRKRRGIEAHSEVFKSITEAIKKKQIRVYEFEKKESIGLSYEYLKKVIAGAFNAGRRNRK